MNFHDIAFVIVMYRSENIIHDCLKELPKDLRKIIVDNSGNEKLKKNIEEQYDNCECYLMDENLGYGRANNFGINMAKTDYVFIINPDTNIDEEKYKKIVSYLKGQDFAIAAPQIIETGKIYKQNNSDRKIIEVKQVPGMAMIINKNKFNKNYFDENIFMYLEETDLCKRMRDLGERILEINIGINHLGGQSHGDYDLEMEKSRNWHWMWSKFYFNKKHHSYFYSFFKTLPNLLSSFLKVILFSLTGNKVKIVKYQMRLQGLINSYLLKKSFYRPYKKKSF